MIVWIITFLLQKFPMLVLISSQAKYLFAFTALVFNYFGFLAYCGYLILFEYRNIQLEALKIIINYLSLAIYRPFSPELEFYSHQTIL